MAMVLHKNEKKLEGLGCDSCSGASTLESPPYGFHAEWSELAGIALVHK
jgi:hypothetical protein